MVRRLARLRHADGLGGGVEALQACLDDVEAGEEAIDADAAVLDRAGVSADGEADDGEPRSAASLERTGEPVSDERLEIFRDFVNSLELDPGDERRGGGRKHDAVRDDPVLEVDRRQRDCRGV